MGPGSTIRGKALERRAAALAEAGTEHPGALVRAEARLAGLTIEVVPIGPRGLPNGERAWLQPVNKRILLSAACKDGEDLEALAHELAHHHLHDERSLEDGYEPFGSSEATLATATATVPGYSPAQAKEVQANLFGDEFLCPSDWLRERLRHGATPAGVADAVGLPRALVRRQAVFALLGSERAEREDAPKRRERNRMQARCVEWRDGPLLVTGGPGTGKTSTLVARAARLLSRRDTPPSSVLVIAGSPRAAESIERRLAARRPASVGKTWVGTFDDLAFEVLARWPDAVRRQGIRVLDRVALLRLLVEAMETAGRVRVPLHQLLGASRGIDGAHDDHDGPDREIEASGIQGAIDALLVGENAVAAAGLVPLAIEMLRVSPFVRENLRRTFRHVLVDDLQDAPATALELLELIHPVSVDVYATGDAGQAMDGFLGRRSCPIEAFRTAFSPEHLDMHRNHRSTAPVAAVVDVLVRSGASRPIRPILISPAVTYSEHDDTASEAAAVAARVVATHRAGTPLARQAVLAWSHEALETLARALSAAGVPMAHLGDLKDRPEVGDVTSFLEFAVDGNDDAFETVARLAPYDLSPEVTRLVRRRAQSSRTPIRTLLDRVELPVGARSVIGLRRLRGDVAALRTAPLTAGLTDWLFATDGYASDLLRKGGTASDRMSLVALHHVLAACAEHERLGGRDAAGLRARIAVVGSLDQRTHFHRVSLHGLGLDAVNLLTIRAARGMEFDVVHVAGLWRKPPRRGEASGSNAQKGAMRVALSRAKQGLHMTRPRKRAGREVGAIGCLLPVRELLGGTNG